MKVAASWLAEGGLLFSGVRIEGECGANVLCVLRREERPSIISTFEEVDRCPNGSSCWPATESAHLVAATMDHELGTAFPVNNHLDDVPP